MCRGESLFLLASQRLVKYIQYVYMEWIKRRSLVYRHVTTFQEKYVRELMSKGTYFLIQFELDHTHGVYPFRLLR